MRITSIALVGLLQGLAGAAAAAPFVLVPCEGDQTLQVVDTAGNAVIRSIPLGGGGAESVAVHPTLPLAWVAVRDAFAVRELNTTTWTVTQSYNVPFPRQLAWSDDNTLILSTDYRIPSGVSEQAVFYQVDLDTGAVTRADLESYLTLQNFIGYQRGVAAADDGFVLVVRHETDQVIAFLGDAGLHTTRVGDSPFSVVVEHGTDRAFVTNRDSDTVTTFNWRTGQRLATIDVGDDPQGLVLDDAHHRLYVSNTNDDTVSIIDTDDNSLLVTFTVGPAPRGLAVHPGTGLLYVVTTGDDSLAVVDTRTLRVVDRVALDDRPIGWGTLLTGSATLVFDPPDLVMPPSASVGVLFPATLRNAGTVDTVITTATQPADVFFTGPDAADFGVSTSGARCGTLGPDDDCELFVFVLPTTGRIGPRHATLVVRARDGSGASASLTLEATPLLPDLHLENGVDPLDRYVFAMGSQRVGESLIDELTLTNRGTDALVLQALPALPAPFSLVSTCPVGAPGLLPNADCTLGLVFAPTVAGSANTSFHVRSNDPDEADVTVTVTGNGTTGPIGRLVVRDSVAPSDDHIIDLGDVDVGTSATATAHLFNAGSHGVLSVTGIAVVGGDGVTVDSDTDDAQACGPLPITVPGPTRPEIPPQLQELPCTVAIAVSPVRAGPATATVIFSSNSADGDVALTVSANGLAPAIAVSPETVQLTAPAGDFTFAEIRIGSVGTTPLTIADIAFAGDDTIVVDDTAGGAPCGSAPFTLDPAHECTVGVLFRPTSTGQQTGTITIGSLDPEHPTTSVLVVGTATPGSVVDAGPGGGGVVDDAGGCDCRQSSSTTTMAVAAAVVGVLAMRRRRRRL